MDSISWDYSNHYARASLSQLLKNTAGKSRRYPQEKQKRKPKDNNSIRVTVERDNDIPIVMIDINVENKSRQQKNWSNPFLHLSVRIQLDLTQNRIHQKQLDSYLTYDGREVSLTNEYLKMIEKYVDKILPLKHTREQGWHLSNLKKLRDALEEWEATR